MAGDEPEQAESPDTFDAFALAGNEVRMAVIKELGEAQGTRGPPAILSFSELRSRVEPGMDSSRFNYHLQQLVGHFIASVDEGYQLEPEGTTLYRTIRAGSFAPHNTLAPSELDADCHFCDSPLEAMYDDGRFTVRCPACRHFYHRQTIPPQAVGDAVDDELVMRADQYHRHQLLASSRGVCPICVNTLDKRFLPADDVTMLGETVDHLSVFAHASCDHCGHQHYMPIGSLLLYDPALVAFCYKRGLDVTSVPVWELDFAATDRYVDIRSRDPWRVVFSLSLKGDELELTINDCFEPVETTMS